MVGGGMGIREMGVLEGEEGEMFKGRMLFL